MDSHNALSTDLEFYIILSLIKEHILLPKIHANGLMLMEFNGLTMSLIISPEVARLIER